MIINSIYAVIATLGFCILFNIRGKKIIFASIGGGIGWFVYLLTQSMTKSIYFPLFTASLAIAVYSEIFARILKTPVTILAIAAMIPLVPGYGMYYTMYYTITGNTSAALKTGIQTFLSAGMIAIALVLVSSLIKVFKNIF